MSGPNVLGEKTGGGGAAGPNVLGEEMGGGGVHVADGGDGGTQQTRNVGGVWREEMGGGGVADSSVGGVAGPCIAGRKGEENGFETDEESATSLHSNERGSTNGGAQCAVTIVPGEETGGAGAAAVRVVSGVETGGGGAAGPHIVERDGMKTAILCVPTQLPHI